MKNIIKITVFSLLLSLHSLTHAQEQEQEQKMHVQESEMKSSTEGTNTSPFVPRRLSRHSSRANALNEGTPTAFNSTASSSSVTPTKLTTVGNASQINSPSAKARETFSLQSESVKTYENRWLNPPPSHTSLSNTASRSHTPIFHARKISLPLAGSTTPPLINRNLFRSVSGSTTPEQSSSPDLLKSRSILRIKGSITPPRTHTPPGPIRILGLGGNNGTGLKKRHSFSEMDNESESEIQDDPLNILHAKANGLNRRVSCDNTSTFTTPDEASRQNLGQGQTQEPGLHQGSINEFMGHLTTTLENLSILQSFEETAEDDDTQNEEEVPPGLKLTFHGQRVDFSACENKSFVKYDNKQLEERELLIDENGQLIDGLKRYIADGSYIYVMHSDGKIYIDQPIEEKVYHSSLAGEDWPIAAGEIFIINNKISLINEESGHYKPFNRVKYVVNKIISNSKKKTKLFNVFAPYFQKVKSELKIADEERVSSLSICQQKEKLKAVLEKASLSRQNSISSQKDLSTSTDQP